MDRGLTFALVLETNNLEGGDACADRICASLERLLHQLHRQTRPLAALAELVVTHHGLRAHHRAELDQVAGRPIRFVRLSEGTGYHDAKNRGFEATTADVVAFGDADCVPDPAWLERLLQPFAEPEGPAVVAGRTTYPEGVLGAAATTIDFMYFPSPLGAGCTRNFYANNVAFRREVFSALRYQEMDSVYRGHCQVLGLRLQAAGVPVRFEPRARTTHRFPDTRRELVSLRLRRGQDAVELSPHFAAAYLPPRWRWLGRRPSFPLGVIAFRFACSVRALGRQEMRPLGALGSLAGVGVIAAISLADAAGAAHRLVRGEASRRRGADARALSYHR
jgi:cellulose synthase/poly-beta-1,6-N-acetylglucosamine synthase-like glycosyltransferase